MGGSTTFLQFQAYYNTRLQQKGEFFYLIVEIYIYLARHCHYSCDVLRFGKYYRVLLVSICLIFTRIWHRERRKDGVRFYLDLLLVERHLLVRSSTTRESSTSWLPQINFAFIYFKLLLITLSLYYINCCRLNFNKNHEFQQKYRNKWSEVKKEHPVLSLILNNREIHAYCIMFEEHQNYFVIFYLRIVKIICWLTL